MEVEHSYYQEKLDIKKLKELRDIISELDVCEQVEVLKIIEKNKIKYTENKNGVFINMNKLNDKTITDLERFIVYIRNNIKKNLI
jgi:hypothetical protein|tara:strand:- start:240 stop:494 length:255 start_codon:yes stop_codon:yes gene_type:complete